MKKLAKRFERVSRNMSGRLGQKAVYNARVDNGIDVITGVQSYIDHPCNVVVMGYPLSARARAELTGAGLIQGDTRWSMLAHFVADVKPRHVLTVGGFDYEVLGSPGPELDEFCVEWTIYARRLR